jgi:ferritin-like protein
MATDQWHESTEQLTEATRNMTRAINSLKEELEAIDWYQQRVDASTDEALKRILAHNRDEEKEHAAMVLEWIRRHDAKFDQVLRTYLFTDGQEITQVEKEAEAKKAVSGNGNGSFGGDSDAGPVQPTFTVGSLRRSS